MYQALRELIVLKCVGSTNSRNLFCFQFLREYTSKVDDLIKDKEAAHLEVKAKEMEEKEVIQQSV